MAKNGIEVLNELSTDLADIHTGHMSQNGEYTKVTLLTLALEEARTPCAQLSG